MKLLRVALDVPLDTLFDYRVPDGLAIEAGDRVAVPFGTRQRFGLAVETASRSEVAEHKLKEVTRVLDGVPRLPPDWLEFIRFLAAYYQHPFGETLVSALPPWLRSLRPLPKKASAVATAELSGTRFVPSHARTAAQAAAIERISPTLE